MTLYGAAALADLGSHALFCWLLVQLDMIYHVCFSTTYGFYILSPGIDFPPPPSKKASL